jgi:hypothetical protein
MGICENPLITRKVVIVGNAIYSNKIVLKNVLGTSIHGRKCGRSYDLPYVHVLRYSYIHAVLGTCDGSLVERLKGLYHELVWVFVKIYLILDLRLVLNCTLCTVYCSIVPPISSTPNTIE